MGFSSGSIDELLGITSECETRVEYEAARLCWLERVVGFDSSYIGAAMPLAPVVAPVVSGVHPAYTAHCEARSDRYWGDRLTLNAAAERAGGVVCDRDAFSARRLDRMPFYDEVIAGLGIRAVALCVLRTQGQVVGCLYLGRTAHGARFGAELERLRSALPLLALGKRLHDLAQIATPAPSKFAPALTRRETQVLELLTQGFTNAAIAARLGTSPRTVKNQIAALFVKAGVKNRTELTYLATRTSVVSPNPNPAAK